MNILSSEFGRVTAMILILIVSIGVGWIIKKGMFFLYQKSRARHKTDPGRFLLLTSGIRLIILIIGVSYAISLEPSVRSLTTSMLASAGIATAIIGFASKDVLANFVSGVVIIVFRPFTITHWIKVGNLREGKVEEIKMLYTVIRDKSNRRQIIPNSKIVSSDVINSSYREEHVLEYAKFQISFDSDLQKAKSIIREVCEKSPLAFDKRSEIQKQNNEPKVNVLLYEIGSYSLTLAAIIWVQNPEDARKIHWIFNEEVRDRFNKEGIVIPYPNLIVKESDNK